MVVLFNNKYHFCFQGGFQGTFSLTPADSPFQLSHDGVLTVRNSTLLDREKTPSFHLQVLKISLLLSKASWSKQVVSNLSCKKADSHLSESTACLKNQIWTLTLELSGRKYQYSDAVYVAYNCCSSFLLFLENVFEQSNNFPASFSRSLLQIICHRTITHSLQSASSC